MLLWHLANINFSPNTTVLARVPHTDLYKDKSIYTTVQEVPGIKIFRIDASLYYANVEHFRKKLYKLTTGKKTSLAILHLFTSFVVISILVVKIFFIKMITHSRKFIVTIPVRTPW